MISLVAFSGLMLLSGLPVARAELECDLKMNDTNVCSWINSHEIVLVTICVVGGIVILLSLLGCCLSSARSQQDPGAMDTVGINSNPRAVPLGQYGSRPEASYPFAVPNVGRQSLQTAVAEKDSEWAAVDLSKNTSSHPELRNPPAYNNGYAV